MSGLGWRSGICLFTVGFAITSFAQPKSKEKEYVGAQTCGTCHARQFAQQSASAHARSLCPASKHALADAFVPGAPLVRKPSFRFQFSRGPEEFKVRVTDGKEAVETPVQWAFGAGDQAVTFVSQLDEDRYVEHHFSYYSSARSLDATPGHQDLHVTSLPEALGVVYATFDPEPKIMRCFQCHSTGRLSLGPKFDIIPGEPGVWCEACHGPGSLHVQAVKRGESQAVRKLIENPRRLSAVQINEFCGDCHRKPSPPGVATNWTDAWNTRHQPLYLSQSACFRKSRGALSCLTCHDPHEDLRKNDVPYYNGRCATCHSTKRHPPINVSQTVRPDNCVGCHMPRVAPQAHLRFTNHWIGVYQDGATLKPSR